MTSVVQEWPVLQAEARTGKTKFWQVRVLKELNAAAIEVEFWLDGGVHQKQAKKVHGKNIGRSNETTPLEQAILEARAQIKKQMDKGYSEDGQFSGIYTLPMLAQDFKHRSNRINFPCFVQPKLDGVRCLFNPRRGFWSRLGKPFNAVDLKHLRWDSVGDITLDGELILPPPFTFQETTSAIKKQSDLTQYLEYHVFDVVLEGTFYGRWCGFWNDNYHNHYPNKPEGVVRVQTEVAQSIESMEEYLQQFLIQGYEGAILRNFSGEYEIGQRSNDLQKYKLFVDGEYRIVDVVDGEGKEEGASIFVCRTEEDKEFTARPRGTYKSRQQQFQNKEKYIGKILTVRYQNLTDKGLPRFPVAVAVRDYE